MWHGLAQLPFAARLVIKLLLFLVVLVVVLFPHPVHLANQIRHLADTESLIQPGLPFIKEINREIDAALPPHPTPEQELKAVERFVYDAIPYAYDWHVWSNVDYWPTAAEVWEKRREDCDGRAVLSASILRARGFKDARIVANLSHAWVEAGGKGLMGAQQDKNFSREGGRLVIKAPKVETILSGLCQVRHFPAWRLGVLVLAAVLLAMHPHFGWPGFSASLFTGLTGLALLYVWAARTTHGRDALGWLWMSLGLLAGAFVLAVWLPGCMRRETGLRQDGAARRCMEPEKA